MLNLKTNTRLFLALLGCVCLAAPSQGQDIPYRTSFEAPVFTVGPLGANGQDGWKGSGAIQSITLSMINSGTQSLQIDAITDVTRTLYSQNCVKVYIDGYYHGPTVNSIPDPSTLDDSGSSMVLLHETEGIMALDGDGEGGGTWVKTGVAVSTTALQRITICQDYSTHTWTLYIDKQQVPLSSPQTFGFLNNKINRLNAVDLETSSSGKGYLDDFSATTSVPDFFKEAPFDFSSEWKTGDEGTPNWDLNGDDEVNANDLIEFLSQIFKK